MSKSHDALKCGQWVRNLPLERFRLPSDGRKWKQAARSRSGLLLRLASYANGDGTFVREGQNYSPSFETLRKHIAENSFFRLTNALQELGLLSWTRENHYERRVYLIHLPHSQNQIPDSPEHIPDSTEHLPHSPITPTATVVEHIPHSPKSHTIRGGVPSLPSLSPSTPSPAGGHVTGDQNIQAETTIKPNFVYSAKGMKHLLQKIHHQLYKEFGGDFVETMPSVPNPSGFEELFAELHKRGLDRSDKVKLLRRAYQLWFEEKYLLSFKEHSRAEEKREREEQDDQNTGTVSRLVFVPEPIRCPFKIFLTELRIYLEDAQEWFDEQQPEPEVPPAPTPKVAEVPKREPVDESKPAPILSEGEKFAIAAAIIAGIHIEHANTGEKS
jgi:hypothetical protein